MEAVCARCAHTRACPLHRDSVHATRHKRADGCVCMPRLPQADIPSVAGVVLLDGDGKRIIAR